MTFRFGAAKLNQWLKWTPHSAVCGVDLSELSCRPMKWSKCSPYSVVCSGDFPELSRRLKKESEWLPYTLRAVATFGTELQTEEAVAVVALLCRVRR